VLKDTEFDCLILEARSSERYDLVSFQNFRDEAERLYNDMTSAVRQSERYHDLRCDIRDYWRSRMMRHGQGRDSKLLATMDQEDKKEMMELKELAHKELTRSRKMNAEAPKNAFDILVMTPVDHDDNEPYGLRLMSQQSSYTGSAAKHASMAARKAVSLMPTGSDSIIGHTRSAAAGAAAAVQSFSAATAAAAAARALFSCPVSRSVLRSHRATFLFFFTGLWCPPGQPCLPPLPPLRPASVMQRRKLKSKAQT
jgi:hypothetical protein